MVLHDYFSCLYVEVGGSTVQCSENTEAFISVFIVLCPSVVNKDELTVLH